MTEPGKNLQEPTASEEKNERDLIRIMTYSTALGMGVMAAFLYSLRDIKNDVSFQFSFGTVVAFAIGWAVGWYFWVWLRKRMEQGAESPGERRS